VTRRDLLFREGRPDDARACAASMRSAIRALAPGRHPSRALAAWASLPPLYHRWAMGPGGERYLVALLGGRQLGFAARRGGELTAAFVRPPAQRGGVGRALVEAVARAARREGREQLFVVAALSAVPFYLRLGFCPAGSAAVPLPGGSRLAARRMRLTLSPAPRRPPHGRAGPATAGSRRRSRQDTSTPR
jgi:GNAT superfamily N-acetyltransferase